MAVLILSQLTPGEHLLNILGVRCSAVGGQDEALRRISQHIFSQGFHLGGRAAGDVLAFSKNLLGSSRKSFAIDWESLPSISERITVIE